MNLTPWESRGFGRCEGRGTLGTIELFQSSREQPCKSAEEQGFAVVRGSARSKGRARIETRAACSAPARRGGSVRKRYTGVGS